MLILIFLHLKENHMQLGSYSSRDEDNLFMEHFDWNRNSTTHAQRPPGFPLSKGIH